MSHTALGCWGRVSTVANGGNLGRNKLPWGQELWDRLDMAVHDEMKRILISRRFVPLVLMPDALTVPADTVTEGEDQDGYLEVNEAAVTSLIEIWVEFALTKQQVEGEDKLCTAVTLATRAANKLAQGEDLLIYQGDSVIRTDSLFTRGRIRTRAGPGPGGLATLGPLDRERQVIPVSFTEPTEGTYGEETFAAVASAYSRLQDDGHYGPYSLVLPTVPFADTRRPLANTLIMPADRILPLVEGRFYGTGTLPEEPNLVGVLVSIGGNSLDIVIGRDATTAFVQEDNEGMYRFRVFERFALRDKDPTSRILLDFARTNGSGTKPQARDKG